jgi:hypothetical protein
MRNVVPNVSWALSLFVITPAAPVAAQQAPQPAVTLQATGTFANNGDFAGTLTVNRFEPHGSQVVAVGVVQGTLRRANHVIGTALAAEVIWPVTVRTGGAVVANGRTSDLPAIRHVVWSTSKSPQPRLISVQAGCTPVQIDLGATNVNLLGLDVALDPVGLTVTGQAGTPVGDLVCAVLNLVGNVAGLVNVLNALLRALTGLLGGLALPAV